MDITKLAPLLLHHATASHVPSAAVASETLRLAVVPVDGQSFALPFHVDVHPSTKIVVMHNLICNKLREIHIGEFYRSGLEILPLQEMPTLDQLKGDNLSNLRKRALLPDELPNECVNEWFHPQELNGIHFIVWLPATDREFLWSTRLRTTNLATEGRFPADPGLGIGLLMTLHLREFLSFEDATAASQNREESHPQFEVLLKAEYNQSDEGDLFDMATGEHFPSSIVMASHIFLHKWRRRISHYTSFKNIHDPRNGLLLYRPVEWAFNRGKICVEVNNGGRMIFRLLDHDLSDIRLADKACELRRDARCDGQPIREEVNLQKTFGDLDGQLLQFPPGATMRPSKRLLGLHAVAAWLDAGCNTHDFQIPIPDCNASDEEITSLSFNMLMEAWSRGVEAGAPVSSSQPICWTS